MVLVNGKSLVSGRIPQRIIRNDAILLILFATKSSIYLVSLALRYIDFLCWILSLFNTHPYCEDIYFVYAQTEILNVTVAVCVQYQHVSPHACIKFNT